jgi:hypothetical protein
LEDDRNDPPNLLAIGDEDGPTLFKPVDDCDNLRRASRQRDGLAQNDLIVRCLGRWKEASVDAKAKIHGSGVPAAIAKWTSL